MNNHDTNINKEDIKPKPLEQIPYDKKEVPKKLDSVKKKVNNTISLNAKDVLRIIERFANKCLNYIIGNSENPIPTFSKAHSVLLIIIIVLLILLWVL